MTTRQRVLGIAVLIIAAFGLAAPAAAGPYNIAGRRDNVRADCDDKGAGQNVVTGAMGHVVRCVLGSNGEFEIAGPRSQGGTVGCAKGGVIEFYPENGTVKSCLASSGSRDVHQTAAGVKMACMRERSIAFDRRGFITQCDLLNDMSFKTPQGPVVCKANAMAKFNEVGALLTCKH